MNDKISRTWAEVELGRIKHNVSAIRGVMPKGAKFMGVVKANAYGHGAVPVAKAVLEVGAEYLAVACIAEAEELREAGITAPILILGITPPEFAPVLEELDITQAVSSLDYARALADKVKGSLRVHMKLETGMGRTGFNVLTNSHYKDIYAALRLEKLDFEGVFTHFAVSDCPGDEFTGIQHRRFIRAVQAAERNSGRRFAIRHCANSGVVINYRMLGYDMIRPGVITYGMYPAAEHGGLNLLPALSLRSRIYAINEHHAGDTVSYGRTYTAPGPVRLAVVPIGYADGLHRTLSGKLEVLVRGHRCPQVGRICMDMCMVDVTDVPDCSVGDVVTLIGGDGGETILADELAEKAGTINYEITCALSRRVPRIYT